MTVTECAIPENTSAHGLSSGWDWAVSVPHVSSKQPRLRGGKANIYRISRVSYTYLMICLYYYKARVRMCQLNLVCSRLTLTCGSLTWTGGVGMVERCSSGSLCSRSRTGCQIECRLTTDKVANRWLARTSWLYTIKLNYHGLILTWPTSGLIFPALVWEAWKRSTPRCIGHGMCPQRLCQLGVTLG